MENNDCKLGSAAVDEQISTTVSINSFREEVLLEIFRHLEFDELCRIGRVCKTWYEITRWPELWRRISTRISGSPSSMSVAAFKLAEILPPCVTDIELIFEKTPEMWHLNRKELDSILRARCPNLQTLSMHNVRQHDPFNFCEVTLNSMIARMLGSLELIRRWNSQ